MSIFLKLFTTLTFKLVGCTYGHLLCLLFLELILFVWFCCCCFCRVFFLGRGGRQGGVFSFFSFFFSFLSVALILFVALSSSKSSEVSKTRIGRTCFSRLARTVSLKTSRPEHIYSQLYGQTIRTYNYWVFTVFSAACPPQKSHTDLFMQRNIMI